MARDRMRRALAIVREAAASARSQKVASVLTMAVVAALCSAVLLTAGRTEGSATAVLSRLDASGTRSIVVRAQPGAGLDTTVLDRLRPLHDVAWVAAFGPAEDVTNAAIHGGPRVALRPAYGLHLSAAGAGDAAGDAASATDAGAAAGAASGDAADADNDAGDAASAADADAGDAASAADADAGDAASATDADSVGAPSMLTVASGNPTAFVTSDAARQLGLADGVGVVASSAATPPWTVAGRIELPPDLRFLEPLVLALPPAAASIAEAATPALTAATPAVTSPAARPTAPFAASPAAIPAAPPAPAGTPAAAPQPVAVLVVRASSPALVGAVAAAVTSVLGIDDPTKVTVQTSEQLAQVRQQIAEQLGDFGRGLVLSTFGASAALVAAILYALVMLRRRDFGRRRALGAARSLVVALLLTQVALLALAGAAVGTIAALGVLAASSAPLPSPGFAAAVATLAVLTSVVAAVAPALVASTRDPLRELRVP